jgi:hypothetical protein
MQRLMLGAHAQRIGVSRQWVCTLALEQRHQPAMVEKVLTHLKLSHYPGDRAAGDAGGRR